MQVVLRMAADQLLVLGESHVALDDARAHARRRRVGLGGVLGELHRRATVADRKLARCERATLRAPLQLALERALAHVVYQEEWPRSELHAARLVRAARLVGVALAVVVGQRRATGGQHRSGGGHQQGCLTHHLVHVVSHPAQHTRGRCWHLHAGVPVPRMGEVAVEIRPAHTEQAKSAQDLGAPASTRRWVGKCHPSTSICCAPWA